MPCAQERAALRRLSDRPLPIRIEEVVAENDKVRSLRRHAPGQEAADEVMGRHVLYPDRRIAGQEVLAGWGFFKDVHVELIRDHRRLDSQPRRRPGIGPRTRPRRFFRRELLLKQLVVEFAGPSGADLLPDVLRVGASEPSVMSSSSACTSGVAQEPEQLEEHQDLRRRRFIRRRVRGPHPRLPPSHPGRRLFLVDHFCPDSLNVVAPPASYSRQSVPRRLQRCLKRQWVT